LDGFRIGGVAEANAVLTTSARPRLSVIVPVLNEEAVIEATLASLQPLRAQGAELILVDGGSSDATVRLATPLVDQRVDAVCGRARQMNAGAAVARAEVLLFLHADTQLPAQALEAILSGLQISAKSWGRFDVIIEGQATMLRVVAAMMNWRSRITGIATGDQAIFVRKADFLAVQGFPVQALMEDIALSRNLKQRTLPLCLREKVTTSGRRWLQGGVWRTIGLMWRLRLLYWMGVSPEQLIKEYK
jgi:rSAM/selenodomain-associated transferase 2